jgi:hypothetical protein
VLGVRPGCGGQTALALSLWSASGCTVSLSDYSGKPVLLYFSMGSGRSGCMQQVVDLQSVEAFEKLGARGLPGTRWPRGSRRAGRWVSPFPRSRIRGTALGSGTLPEMRMELQPRDPKEK